MVTEVDTAVLRYAGGVPVYRADMAPDHLGTRRQLRAAGLSHAGLKPAGYLHYNVHHGICPLYDRQAARPVRPLTERQRANLAAGRLLAGTRPCRLCGNRTKWSPTDWEKRGEPVCGPCLPAVRAAAERAEAERQKAQRLAFERMLEQDRQAAAEWARGILADPECAVVDTETTGLLEDHPFAVQIAVTTVGGEVLLDTLVHPQMPIPASSTLIHRITDDMVASAPKFGDVLGSLTDALRGRRTVIWNASFDRQVLRNELERHFAAELPPAPIDKGRPWLANCVSIEAEHRASEWLKAFLSAECAMERYAEWFGDWHPYHQSYTWQRLNGPHSARGDCETVVRRLWSMSGLSKGQGALPVVAKVA